MDDSNDNLAMTIDAAFDEYDEDGSGKIDIKELRNLVQTLSGSRVSDEEIKRYMTQLDSENEDGFISKEEFATWWASVSAVHDEDDATEGGEEGSNVLKRVAARGLRHHQQDIHTAAWTGDVSRLDAFLSANKRLANEPDVTDFGMGFTPLQYASYNGHMDAVQLLVERYAADLNSKNEEGGTALFYAAQQGHADLVAYLLGKRARPDIPEARHGFTAADVAASAIIRDMFVEVGGAPGQCDPPRLVRRGRSYLEIVWCKPPRPTDSALPVSSYIVRVSSLSADSGLAGAVEDLAELKSAAQLSDGVHGDQTLLVDDLRSGWEYVFAVRAVNGVGEGPWSEASKSFTTLCLPPAPATPAIELVTASSAVLTSSAVMPAGQAKITRWRLQWRGVSSMARGSRGDSKLVVAESPAAHVDVDFQLDDDWTTEPESENPRFEIRRLVPGSKLKVRVSAYNKTGWGPWSEIALVTILSNRRPSSASVALSTLSGGGRRSKSEAKGAEPSEEKRTDPGELAPGT